MRFGPQALAKADFNGDGMLDLAVVNNGSNNVAILPKTGPDSFGIATTFPVNSSPTSVVAGDLNGDGAIDLAVANSSSANISVLLGTGTGSFGAATSYAAGTTPFCVAAGDLNGDGNLDLAVANTGSANISILLGTGTGTFGAATHFAAGTQTRYVGVADFNGDGKLDLVSVNQGANNISILLGTGTGSFGAATNFAVGGNPWSAAIADVNADGKLDLLVANTNVMTAGSTVSVLRGTGTGTFSAATNYFVGNVPRAVAVSDFNADGKLDMVVTNQTNNISVLLGTGTGSFSLATPYPLPGAGPLGPWAIEIADFSGDGRPDVVVANSVGNAVALMVTLPVQSFPVFSAQPIVQGVLEGASAVFTVAVASIPGGALTYQWRRNGVNLVNSGNVSGATTSTLVISPTVASDNGSAFDCIVTNGCGSSTSGAAGLAIGDSCLADFNNDGNIDFFDYLDFVDAYSIGC